MSITAMKEMANYIDALGGDSKKYRQAIEQAEKQEPRAWMYDRAKYRENDLRGRQWAFKCVSQTKPYMDEMVRNVTPLYTHPQPKRKWVEVECPLCGEMAVAHTHPVLTTPQPKREWVGLTDTEIEEFDYYARDLVMDIEKALKEKNNVA